MPKQKPALANAGNQGNGRWFIDHARIVDADAEWLNDVRHLILWAVEFPRGFLRRLPALQWLDLRGGSTSDLSEVAGMTSLTYLRLNHIRGIVALDELPSLSSLMLLDIYGLSNLRRLPSFAPLDKLVRVEIGQVRSLQSISPVLEAPVLEELVLNKRVAIDLKDAERINAHPTMKKFGWTDIEGVPSRVWEPVCAAISLERVHSEFPEDWFAHRSRTRKQS